MRWGISTELESRHADERCRSGSGAIGSAIVTISHALRSTCAPRYGTGSTGWPGTSKWNLTQLVEELAAHAERAVEGQLSCAALKRYRAAGYEDTA
jgi:hypothetical protein